MQEVQRKYPDALKHIQSVEDLEGSVLFGVDATRLEGSKALKAVKQRFSKVVFNFPHAGGWGKWQGAVEREVWDEV